MPIVLRNSRNAVVFFSTSCTARFLTKPSQDSTAAGEAHIVVANVSVGCFLPPTSSIDASHNERRRRAETFLIASAHSSRCLRVSVFKVTFSPAARITSSVSPLTSTPATRTKSNDPRYLLPSSSAHTNHALRRTQTHRLFHTFLNLVFFRHHPCRHTVLEDGSGTLCPESKPIHPPPLMICIASRTLYRTPRTRALVPIFVAEG